MITTPSTNSPLDSGVILTNNLTTDNNLPNTLTNSNQTANCNTTSNRTKKRNSKQGKLIIIILAIY